MSGMTYPRTELLLSLVLVSGCLGVETNGQFGNPNGSQGSDAGLDQDADVGIDEEMLPPAPCDNPATCEYDPQCAPPADLSLLATCGADAHCFPADRLDPQQAAMMAPCELGPSALCVPDTFLLTGGLFTPASCQANLGLEGRCLSVSLPSIAAGAAVLPQSTCAPTERCAACFDLVTDRPTGACSVSCDLGPISAAPALPQCCESYGRCIPREAITDPELEDVLDEKECEDIENNAFWCVPNELLQGTSTPCQAHSLFLGDYTGVCLSECLDFGLAGIAFSEGSCDNDYDCVPCERDGEPTGAPGCPVPPGP